MKTILGWDIGGANLKAAWLVLEPDADPLVQVAARPFQIWREAGHLREALVDVWREFSSDLPDAMAVTMTAELADVFITKREGVRFVLEGLRSAFPDCPAYIFSLQEQFVPLPDALDHPLDFAATNWLATSLFVATRHPNCTLIDIGSTTADIIPILGGRVASRGRTDLERLIAGELVYTGVLRTHLAAIAHFVPVGGEICRVSSEYFAISGDVHLIQGHIGPLDYTCPTPDGRPASIASARQRLARLVCADTEMLSEAEIDEMAAYLAEQQVQQICAGLQQVLSHQPALRKLPVITAGLGSFLAKETAGRLGLACLDLGVTLGRQVSTIVPCLAAAHLLAYQLEEKSP